MPPPCLPQAESYIWYSPPPTHTPGRGHAAASTRARRSRRGAGRVGAGALRPLV